jgi:hypothetical protein
VPYAAVVPGLNVLFILIAQKITLLVNDFGGTPFHSVTSNVEQRSTNFPLQ